MMKKAPSGHHFVSYYSIKVCHKNMRETALLKDDIEKMVFLYHKLNYKQTRESQYHAMSNH